MTVAWLPAISIGSLLIAGLIPAAPRRVPPVTTQESPACLPDVQGESAAINARLQRVREDPAAFLPRLDLARCFDLSWQLEHVEAAITAAHESFIRERPEAVVDEPAPRRLSAPPPVYPVAAMVNGLTGLVIVEALVDERGVVTDATAARSVPGLDDAAVAAVRQWKFSAVVADGKPASSRAFVAVKFGQTSDLWPSDHLDISAFYYRRRLWSFAESALVRARDVARLEATRYGRIYTPATIRGIKEFAWPRVQKEVKPKYFDAAQRARVTGDLELRILIDPAGVVGRVSVVDPLPYLTISGMQTAMQWRFVPARYATQPVSMVAPLVLTFRL